MTFSLTNPEPLFYIIKLAIYSKSMSKPARRGFTLVELLVVIAIIAILSVIGVTVFTGIQKNARDSKRKADIESIAKAYEVKYNNTGTYGDLDPTKSENTSLFSSKAFPKDPRDKDYTIVVNGTTANASGFRVCAALERNGDDTCASVSNTCFCKSSIQGQAPGTLGTTGVIIVTNTGASGLATKCDASLSSNLVGHWKMDDNFNDSAKNNNGTAIGSVSMVEGKIGKAGSFGGNGYVNIPSSSTIDFATNDFTVSAWIKSTQGDRVVLGKYSGRGWGLYVYSTAGIDFFGYGSPPNDARKDATPLFDGSWHLVTGVYDFSGDSLTITSYRDVSAVGTNTVTTGSLANSSAAFQIGTYASYNPPFTGQIDDVRIYNRVLSLDDVGLLYNNSLGCVAP